MLQPTLEVNLAALARNYQKLVAMHAYKSCAAVVKANAYGLGVKEVAQALEQAGCREFFVATIAEGAELRAVLPNVRIFVFRGARRNEAKDLIAHRLIPVLNDRGQWDAWKPGSPCALHVDTGMCRLGLTLAELAKITFTTHTPQLLISHLACANEPDNPKNDEQLKAFRTARQHMPSVPASFANSSGIFLGTGYHFDLLRPGCSLYGISPNTDLPNPMEHVATLSAPVLQIREIDEPQSVGYGALAHVTKGQVLATMELGYADGFQRILTGHAYGYAHGAKLPVVGRISMDMVSVDITALPANLRNGDLRIQFICPEQTVDEVAEAADTIGYEIFTGIGKRVKRVYI